MAGALAEFLVGFIYYSLFIVVLVLTTGITHFSQLYRGWFITWTIALYFIFVFSFSAKSQFSQSNSKHIPGWIVLITSIAAIIPGILFWVGVDQDIARDNTVFIQPTNPWRSYDIFMAGTIVWSFWIATGFLYFYVNDRKPFSKFNF